MEFQFFMYDNKKISLKKSNLRFLSVFVVHFFEYENIIFGIMPECEYICNYDYVGMF